MVLFSGSGCSTICNPSRTKGSSTATTSASHQGEYLMIQFGMLDKICRSSSEHLNHKGLYISWTLLQEQKPIGKRNPATRPFKAIIKVKPQPKKAKATEKEEKEIPGNGKPASHIDQASLDSVKGNVTGKTTEGLQTGLALVSYSDESEDDD